MQLNYDTILEQYKYEEAFKKYLYAKLNKSKNNNSNGSLYTQVLEQEYDIPFFSHDEDAYVKWRNKIYSVLLTEDAINGEEISIEDYLNISLETLKDEEIITNWFNRLYFDAIQSSKLKIGILHALSHIDYNKIYPVGQMIALAGLTDPDDEVIEFSIKAFENWQDRQSALLLKNRQLKKDWLQEYLDAVIKSLEDT